MALHFDILFWHRLPRLFFSQLNMTHIFYTEKILEYTHVCLKRYEIVDNHLGYNSLRFLRITNIIIGVNLHKIYEQFY